MSRSEIIPFTSARWWRCRLSEEQRVLMHPPLELQRAGNATNNLVPGEKTRTGFLRNAKLTSSAKTHFSSSRQGVDKQLLGLSKQAVPAQSLKSLRKDSPEILLRGPRCST